MELPQSDAALERFDRLKVREVRAKRGQTAAFLAQFQSTAASLQPNERIELMVDTREPNMESLKAVLADPQANKICSLKWWYDGKKDMNSIAPLLISNCPELVSLGLRFKHCSEFDFVSNVLEHPSNKIKVLAMPGSPEGDFARFFAALGQSQVSALALSIGDSSEFDQGLCEYLARDLLVRLKVFMGNEQVPSAMMVSLAACTRLAKLELLECEFSQSTVFPKSITKLELESCTFVGDFDWSFLTDSNVRELAFHEVEGVDGERLGGALAVYLRAKGLDKLRVACGDFVNETLAVGGVELGRIKRLDIDSPLNDASVEQIAFALKSPNSEMKELSLWHDDMASSTTHLVPALKHPNCNLAKLSFRAFGSEHEEAAERMEDMFYNRLALFVLLQGRQVRRQYCPLSRLPVEMLRLVGEVLI